jgi:hypothetical protein
MLKIDRGNLKGALKTARLFCGVPVRALTKGARASSIKQRNQRSPLISPAKPVDLDALRHQITNLVAHNSVELVEAAIEDAQKGHYLAMKYLFEIIGLYPPTVSEKETQENETLSGKLLDGLRILHESNSKLAVGDQSTSGLAKKTSAVECK